MKEPGIRIWKTNRKDGEYFLNGVMLSKNSRRVLINPVSLNEDSFRELEEFSPFHAIYLSNRSYEEAALEFKERLKIPIAVHELEAEFLNEEPGDVFRDGQELLCGLKVVHLHDQKFSGESLFYLSEQKTVIGSALIGHPEGELSLLADAQYADVRKAQAGLRRLFSLNFETFFVSAGEPIFEDAYGRLTDCFAALKSTENP